MRTNQSAPSSNPNNVQDNQPERVGDLMWASGAEMAPRDPSAAPPHFRWPNQTDTRQVITPPPPSPVGQLVDEQTSIYQVDGPAYESLVDPANPFGPSNLSATNLTLETNPNAIVNVTREYPFDYAMVMFGYIMPFVLVITLITNFLVIAVLSRRHMRTPSNIVLMTMAIVDIGTMASPAPWYLYIYTFGNHDKFLYPPSVCYAHYIMTDVIPIFLHTSSIWLALLLASQRYIYVCHPQVARTWCTVPRVKRAVLTILVVALGHQLTHFVDIVFKRAKIEQNGAVMDACSFGIAPWLGEWVNFYFLTYFTFRIFFVFIIPCTALLLLNIALFRALRRTERRRAELFANRSKRPHQNALSESPSPAAGLRAQLPSSAFEPSSYAVAEAQAKRNHKQVSRASFLIARAPIADGGGVAARRGQPPEVAKKETNAACADKPQPPGSKAKLVQDNCVEEHECVLRRQSSSSRGGEQLSESAATGDDEDESTCAECSALARRRCSADEMESVLACRRAQGHSGHANHFHQHSQCSSVLATNTTANEANSSAGSSRRQATNNSNSSSDNTTDGPLERDERNTNAIGTQETLDVESDFEGADEELNLPLEPSSDGEEARSSCLAPAANGPNQRRSKSGGSFRDCSSAEGRAAACGCLRFQARALRRLPRLSGRKTDCLARPAECCRMGPMSGHADKPTSCDTPSAVSTRASLRSAGRRSSGTLCDGRELPFAAAATNIESSKLNGGPSVAATRTGQRRQRNFLRRTSESAANRLITFARTSKRPSFGQPGGGGRESRLCSSAAATIPSLIISAGVDAPAIAAQQQQANRLPMDSNRTTLMLIVVVSVFLIVEVPVAAVTITHVILSSFDTFSNVDFNNALNYIKLFTNFFIMISYSINFTIYCSMSKKFRETFRELFFCDRSARGKRESNRLMYQTQIQQQQQQSQCFTATTASNININNNFNNGAKTNNRHLETPPPATSHVRGAGNAPSQLEQPADRLHACNSALSSEHTTQASVTTTLVVRGSAAAADQHEPAAAAPVGGELSRPKAPPEPRRLSPPIRPGKSVIKSNGWPNGNASATNGCQL